MSFLENCLQSNQATKITSNAPVFGRNAARQAWHKEMGQLMKIEKIRAFEIRSGFWVSG